MTVTRRAPWVMALGSLLVVAVVAPAPVSAAPVTTASAAVPVGTEVAVDVAPRTVVARPGFRSTPSGPVLDVARFTTVAALALPGSAADRAVVLRVTVRVDVPTRIALSVRAWCWPAPAGAVRTDPVAPDGSSLRDVLVIGQNPVPGRSREQVASRTLVGRAVVTVPAGRPARCLAQLSPRTETTVGSRLRVLSGGFAAAPEQVVARGAQRPAVLVGAPAAPGWPSGVGARAASHPVAGLAPVAAPGAVRLEGEAELTTCALGYHLCARGTTAPSVVDVVLVLADVDASGAVCRTWRGSTRRTVITPAVHHVKVLVPALVPTARCGVAVRGHLLVEHRGGNVVEVEPTLGVAGGARLVQTHTWLARG